MAISVVMPALELTQETGKLVSWRKKKANLSPRVTRCSRSRPTKQWWKWKRSPTDSSLE